MFEVSQLQKRIETSVSVHRKSSSQPKLAQDLDAPCEGVFVLEFSHPGIATWALL